MFTPNQGRSKAPGGPLHTSIEHVLAGLFGRGVVVRVATPEMYAREPSLVEAEQLARMVDKRRREFLAGRACAYAVLEALGRARGPVARGADGAPQWPAGVVGSITHCDGFCCAAATTTDVLRALGVDAETAVRLDPAVERLFAGDGERSAWARLGREPRCGWGIIAFSIKEAVFKTRAPFADAPQYSDIRIALIPASPLDGRFEAIMSGAAAEGFWFIDEGRVHAGAMVR
jgi:4'-phosphopantetheinyl transferase EntD